jgi:ubiquinone/menaquinone biosynthesis C-methylase UbiE
MKSKAVCKGGGAMMPHRQIDLWTIQDHLARYAFAADFVEDKAVLDVACGCGYGSAHLFDKGAKMVVGGDIYVPAIEAARKFYMKPGVEFLVLDATKLPFADNSFEVVVSMETIEHLEQYRDYLRECRRVLKPGGIFICSTPNRYSPFGLASPGSVHFYEFSKEEFQTLLSQFFKEVELYGQGWWHKEEKIKLRITSTIKRTLHPLTLHIPGLYKVVSPFYRYLFEVPYAKVFCRYPHMRLIQVADWDMILSEMGEEHRIIPICSGSLTPRTIIAVARKKKTTAY